LSAASIFEFVLHAALRTRRLWLVGVALLLLGAAYGGRAPRHVLAQTDPPGPQLAAGDFINPDNRVRTATWEAFPADNPRGEVLYIWTTTYVSRAYPCATDPGVGPMCMAWIQYIWDPIDPYNTGLWTPFQRGCMFTGDDPFNVGEADGVSVVTDIYAAGDTYIAVNRATESVATLNPLSPGFAANPGAAALASMTPYPCGGGGAVAGGGGCSSWAGNWSTSYGAMQLTQSGSSVTGTYEDNGGRIAGSASGNTLTGTWSEAPSYTPPDDAGDFQFTMSADGTSFSGGWRYGSSGSFTNDWTGSRTCSGTPSSGGAACSVTGSWQTIQNGSIAISFTFQQSGTTVTGTASAPSLSLNGTVSGTLMGNQLSVVVTWRPGLQGQYSGAVSPGQITNGSTYQVGTSPATAVSWSGTGPATCGGGGTPGPVQSGTISGTWDANNGVYTFTQNGSSVSATIAFSGGLGSATLQGTLNNGTVQATWSCNSDCPVPGSHGTVTLTVSSNGCKMQGSYVSMVGSQTTGTGPLTMTKRGCSG
jgi:hypothetical protein